LKFDQLAYATPAAVRSRSSAVRVTHLGVEDVDGVGLTDIFSVGAKSENYLAWIYIDEHDQCLVSCACKYFCFTLETALANAGASVVLYSNGEAPVERNPLQRKFLCKHLYKIWQGKSKYNIEHHSEEEVEEPIEEEVEPEVEEEPEVEPEPEPEQEPEPEPEPEEEPEEENTPGGKPK